VPRFLTAEEILLLSAMGSDFSSQTDMLMRNTRPKILVVDDERAIASTLATILENRGYETATAYSGEEAVQMACSFRPDCLVSDVFMGAMNGIDAAIEVSLALPWCKVLLVSGNAGYGDLLEKAKAKGFDFELLLKPVPPAELLLKIARMLLHSADHTAGG
jgi:CheY-like chemotaxis protein